MESKILEHTIEYDNNDCQELGRSDIEHIQSMIIDGYSSGQFEQINQLGQATDTSWEIVISDEITYVYGVAQTQEGTEFDNTIISVYQNKKDADRYSELLNKEYGDGQNHFYEVETFDLQKKVETV